MNTERAITGRGQKQVEENDVLCNPAASDVFLPLLKREYGFLRLLYLFQ